MISYRRYIPLPALTLGTADAAAFPLTTAYGLRKEEKWRHEAELVDWEEEGGGLAAPASAPQSS